MHSFLKICKITSSCIRSNSLNFCIFRRRSSPERTASSRSRMRSDEIEVKRSESEVKRSLSSRSKREEVKDRLTSDKIKRTKSDPGDDSKRTSSAYGNGVLIAIKLMFYLENYTCTGSIINHAVVKLPTEMFCAFDEKIAVQTLFIMSKINLFCSVKEDSRVFESKSDGGSEAGDEEPESRTVQKEVINCYVK